jgi:hypothetical protein
VLVAVRFLRQEQVAWHCPTFDLGLVQSSFDDYGMVQYIQSHGIEVMHIPGGCTYVCQPVDVDINRPLKQKLSLLWEEWFENEGHRNSEASPPRSLIADWIFKAYDSIDEEIVKKACGVRMALSGTMVAFKLCYLCVVYLVDVFIFICVFYWLCV